MNRLISASLVAIAVATPALADFDDRRSPDDVATTMDRLVAAVENAGATVFARVDHAAGAASVDLELEDAQLLIFGNPMLGTPAMQDDPRAGLVLPMRVLVHADANGSVIVWEEPEEMFDDMRIDDDAEYVREMERALMNLAAAAAGE